MSKRIISLVVAITMMFSIFSTAFAFNESSNEPLSEDALLVSPEYADAHPYGVFEFATVGFETKEGAEDFDVIVVRRGGTKGKVSVDFKAIDVSAKYGKDYTVSVPALFGDRILEGIDNIPTLLEASIEETKDEAITDEGVLVSDVNNGQADKTVTESVYESVSDSVYDSTPDFENFEELEPIKTFQTDTYSSDSKSSLHELRDEVFGTHTEQKRVSTNNISPFEVVNPELNKVTDALNTLIPGASSTLTFEDGENYKIFRVHIMDDSIYEAPEQFVLGLYEPSGGGELGNTLNVTANIEDNDEYVAQEIGLDSDSYYVTPSDEYANVNIVRSKGIYDYAKIEISTISGTAKADEHYSPVMTEALFMPGETSKKVKIPLLVTEVSKPLEFEIAVTQEDKPVSGINRATITISPDNSGSANVVKPFSAANTLTAFATANTLTAYSGSNTGIKNYTDKIIYYPDQFEQGRNWGIDYHWNGDDEGKQADMYLDDAGNLHLDCEHFETRINEAYIDGVDLRGINKVSVYWANTGSDSNQNRSNFRIGDKGFTFLNTDDLRNSYAGPGFGFSEFERKNNQKITVGAEAHYRKKSLVEVHNVTLYKQRFNIDIRTADKLSYSIYTGTGSGSKSETYQYNPGSIEFSIQKPYRDQKVSLIANYTDEAQKRGTVLVGYKIYDNKTSTYSDTIRSTQITFTPDFIENNIYGGHGSGSDWNESLIIKPVFERRNAGRFEVVNYDENRGELRVNGRKYDNKRFYVSGMKVGDILQVDLVPKTGYTAKGIDTRVETSSRVFPKNYTTLPCMVEANEKVVMTPKFERNDNTVLISWKAPSTGNVENSGTNRKRGMIFHDRPEDMLKKIYCLTG